MTDLQAYALASGGRPPPLCGYDTPDDYDSGAWVASRSWTFSAAESGARELKVIAFLVAFGLRSECYVEKLAGEVLKRHTRLRLVRERAIAAGREHVRQGRIPVLPEVLADTQRSESAAFEHLVRLIRPVPRTDGPRLLAHLLKTPPRSLDAPFAKEAHAFLSAVGDGASPEGAFADVIDVIRKEAT